MATGAAIAVGVVGSYFAAQASEEAAEEQSDAAREATELQIEANERAAAILERNRDESVSDQEAAQLLAEGRISEAEKVRIEELNKATNGLTENLRALMEYSKSEEEKILEDIVQSGIYTREELNRGAMDNLARTAGLSEKAISALSPYNEAGKKALQMQLFLSGNLSKEEEAAFRAERGIAPGEIVKSPLQLGAEESLNRRLRQIGQARSGLGLESFARLGAELQEKQFQQSGEIASRGLSAATKIADIRTGQGQLEATIRQRLSDNLAEQRQNELARRNALRNQGLKTRLNLGQLSAESQYNTGQEIGRIREATQQNLASIATRGAEARGAFRTGTATNLGNIAIESGKAQAQATREAAAYDAEAQQARTQAYIQAMDNAFKIYAASQNSQGGY